jgi:hypothetical protein
MPLSFLPTVKELSFDLPGVRALLVQNGNKDVKLHTDKIAILVKGMVVY